MTNKYEFEVMPMSWFKRRQPTKDSKEIKRVNVDGFEKKDNAYCNSVSAN